MSEILNNGYEQTERLLEYARGLQQGTLTREHYDAYRDNLHTATAWEVNEVIDKLVAEIDDENELERSVARFIRAAGQGLEQGKTRHYPENHLLTELLTENDALNRELSRFSALFKELVKSPQEGSALNRQSERLLSQLTHHYEGLQNKLFPALEKTASRYRCTKLMWSLQNSVLADLKEIRELAAQGAPEEFPALNRLMGRFFITVRSLIYREEYILYPVAYRAIPEAHFLRLLNGTPEEVTTASPGAITGRTGSLSEEELFAVFQHLPIDFAVIGADDRVRFFSDPAHRIFHRDPAVIGRRVADCHPPKSVAAVEAILEAFKSGKRERASFWLELNTRFIVINYYALRDQDGTYRGTLETAQDATDIRALTGERRLLEWD